MRLEKREYPNIATRVVDLDRDCSGRPLIVARTYDDATLRLLLAAPGLVEALEPFAHEKYISDREIGAALAALAAAKGTT